MLPNDAQKRKAQNRAAQRAFRERKEKHLKDLETKVEDLEKASETTNQENGLLRAQVERLQVELKEYRKRLSWISNSGQGASSSLSSSTPGAAARNSLYSNQNDFQFEFPRFGDLPANQLVNKSGSNNKPNNHPSRSSTLPSKPSNFGVPGVVGRNVMPSSSPTLPAPSYGSTGNSPMNASNTSPPVRNNQIFASNSSFDSFSGLFSPSILEASRQASSGYFPQQNIANYANQASRKNSDHKILNTNIRQHSASSLSNTDSPNSSYESQQNGSSLGSSIGTSPEPSLSSPGQKVTDYGLLTISEENQPQNNFAGEPPF
jgi:AP-1-like transcription factor